MPAPRLLLWLEKGEKDDGRKRDAAEQIKWGKRDGMGEGFEWWWERQIIYPTIIIISEPAVLVQPSVSSSAPSLRFV